MLLKILMQLYNHQQEYLESHGDSEYFALFWEMGSGKTRAILETARRLYERGEINTVVIIAPKGVHVNWTRRQVPLWLSDIQTGCITWTHHQRSKKWRQEAADVMASDCLKIIAMNVEAFSTKGGNASQFIDQIINRNGASALLVIDESSTIKNPKANRSKLIVAKSQRFKYRRILTGTPATQSPFDVWSQGEALKKGIWGRNYYMFRQRYGEFRVARFGSRSYEELVCYRNLDELKESISCWSSQVVKNDCLDLPPKIYEVVDVEMSDAQRKAYKEMRDYLLTEVKNETVLVDNALTKLTKLHQITAGHIIDEHGVPHRLEHHRLTVLQDILNELTCKVIIFSQYVECVKEIMELLGDRAVEYSGRIGEDIREDNVDRFQNDDAVRYIVISLQSSGAYGLDLYNAGAVVYYTNGYSLERRMQSEDRAHRPGQSHDKVVYIDMVSTDTVDENVQKALTNKIDVASKITSLMKSWLR